MVAGIAVHASSVELIGGILFQFQNNSPTTTGLYTSTFGAGNAGNILVVAKKLLLQNGAQIASDTLGGGKGGNLRITASDSVELIGGSTGGQLFSELDAGTGSGSSGQGGNLTINAKNLLIRDGAKIDVSILGTGDAGNIEVSSHLISFDNGGDITAENILSSGGNITLRVQDLLLIRHNSQISTSAGTVGASGNGGNITINSPNGFIVAAPNENNDITANAFLGSGGKVQINALGTYNLNQLSLKDLERLLETTDPNELDPQKLLTNDITAISLTSPILSGQVNLITSDIDPSRGLITLPTVTENIPKLISSSCAAFNETANGSQFTVTGSGGLPPSPDEPLTSDVVWSDTRLPVTIAPHQHKTQAAKPKPQPTAIIPATGWILNDKGEVTLISSVTNATTLNTLTSCPVR